MWYLGPVFEFNIMVVEPMAHGCPPVRILGFEPPFVSRQDLLQLHVAEVGIFLVNILNDWKKDEFAGAKRERED